MFSLSRPLPVSPSSVATVIALPRAKGDGGGLRCAGGAAAVCVDRKTSRADCRLRGTGTHRNAVVARTQRAARLLSGRNGVGRRTCGCSGGWRMDGGSCRANSLDEDKLTTEASPRSIRLPLFGLHRRWRRLHKMVHHVFERANLYPCRGCIKAFSAPLDVWSRPDARRVRPAIFCGRRWLLDRL